MQEGTKVPCQQGGRVFPRQENEAKPGHLVEPAGPPLATDLRLGEDRSGEGGRSPRRPAVNDAVVQVIGGVRPGAPAAAGAAVQAGVPCGRRGLVDQANEVSQPERQPDGRGGVWLALALVGVKQRGVLAAPEHHVELPGQVGRVFNAGAQALAGERGHLVGRVAGDQDPSGPPPVRAARPDRVDGVPV